MVMTALLAGVERSVKDECGECFGGDEMRFVTTIFLRPEICNCSGWSRLLNVDFALYTLRQSETN
jgi:hypothetical protein